jgi:hypothetical protein
MQFVATWLDRDSNAMAVAAFGAETLSAALSEALRNTAEAALHEDGACQCTVNLVATYEEW